jgi:type II secretory pathway pseudopilin PulG
VVGTAAGTALVLLRARRRAARRRRPENALDAAERALRDVFGEARKLLEGDLRR